MSLDDIISEAKEAGLGPNEVETAKRQYFFGILKYDERQPSPDFHKYGSAILGMIAHNRNREYCGEAFARKYIRETSERLKQNESQN